MSTFQQCPHGRKLCRHGLIQPGDKGGANKCTCWTGPAHLRECEDERCNYRRKHRHGNVRFCAYSRRVFYQEMMHVSGNSFIIMCNSFTHINGSSTSYRKWHQPHRTPTARSAATPPTASPMPPDTPLASGATADESTGNLVMEMSPANDLPCERETSLNIPVLDEIETENMFKVEGSDGDVLGTMHLDSQAPAQSPKQTRSQTTLPFVVRVKNTFIDVPDPSPDSSQTSGDEHSKSCTLASFS